MTTRFRKMGWAVGAAVLVAIGAAGASVAQSDPVAERQALMKQVGQQMKDASGFASGQTPFDPAKVKAVTNGIAANAKKAQRLFPANTAAHPKSSTDPKAWTNKADFDKQMAQMAALATAAGNAKDVNAYKPAFQKLSATCKTCHDVYRKKKA